VTGEVGEFALPFVFVEISVDHVAMPAIAPAHPEQVVAQKSRNLNQLIGIGGFDDVDHGHGGARYFDGEAGAWGGAGLWCG
jgi:hypothetical protein